MNLVDVFYLAGPESRTSTTLRDAARMRGSMQVVDCSGSVDVVPSAVAHAYGGPKFLSRLAGLVDLAAIEPADDWLAQLPSRFSRRHVELMPLSEAAANGGRMFVKAPREKDFEAGVYTGSQLPRSGSADPMVLVSEIVSFTREWRLFVLDGQVVTGSRYASSGQLDVRPLDEDPERAQVEAFAALLLDAAADTLPSAVTVDVGWAVDPDRGTAGFAAVEANMAWFSNIYDCAPDHALDVVLRSTGPPAGFDVRDRRFIRITSEKGSP